MGQSEKSQKLELKAQKAIASRIKSYREASGKSIEEFADYMELSIPMIRKIEGGTSGFYAHKSLKIANFLNISVSTLLAADNLIQEPIILRKNLIETAKKLANISDPTLRRNISDLINNLSAKD